MKGRNEALKCFPKEVKRGMNYVPLDLDEDMAVARNKAESFLVAKANQLLDTDSKENAELAWNYVDQLQRIADNNEDAQLQMLYKKYLLRSADKVLLTVENEDERPLLPQFVNTVMSFDEGEIPANVFAVSEKTRQRGYDAQVIVMVKDIRISPDRLDEVTFKENKEGKTVEVTDHSQNKTVTLNGVIRYYSADDYRPWTATPFEVTSTFKNDYTTIKGDREACSAETLGRLNSQPVPVPTDESMLIDAAKKLNDLIATELKK